MAFRHFGAANERSGACIACFGVNFKCHVVC
jgi:hypothetical protein